MYGIVVLALCQSFTFSPLWSSGDSGISMDVCAFDANGDEYIDILYAGYSAEGTGELQLYINNNGMYSSSPDWVSSHEAAYQCVCVGDVDNDGDLDIAAGTVRAGSNYAYNCLFLNNGNGGFTGESVWYSSDDMDTIHMQLADIDGDGWLELISANYMDEVLIYENEFSFGGTLQQNPESCFNGTEQTSFAVSQLQIDDPTFEHVDIVCSGLEFYAPGNSLIQVNKVCSYSSSTSSFIEKWSSVVENRPTTGFWYQCFDLNGDDDLDWIAQSWAPSILAGIYSSSDNDFSEIEINAVNLYPGAEEFNFRAVCNISVADVIPEEESAGPEIFVCNRGMRQFSSIFGEHEMHMAEDMLLSVDWSSPDLESTVVWISDEKTPTTAVAFADVDRQAIYTKIKAFSVTIANQAFFLDSPIERELSVSVDGISLLQNQYHLDRNTGLFSLIGDFTGSSVSITYERSNSLDAICATTEDDVVIINGI